MRSESKVGKEDALNACISLIKKIELNNLHPEIFINIKIKLLLLSIRFIYDNNYSQKFIIRVYNLCSELNEMLSWDKIEPNILKDIEERFDLLLGFNIEPILNSVGFYSKKIEELQSKLNKQNNEIDNQNSDVNEETLKLQSSIKSLTQEKEAVEKQDDAISNWKNKITKAFQGLKAPISKLQDEHNRLKFLYNIYGITSTALVLLLITIEIAVCYKINNTILYPNWEQYWTMIIPVPVAIGLLWGFITQMNRAQRQMVVLARQIYEIEYIEGLLQALNTLSVDIGESMSKINEAISHLIDNHLRNMDGIHIDETTLQKLEKQDALPYEKIPELIKLIKDK